MPETDGTPDLALLALLDPEGKFRHRLREDCQRVAVLRRALSLGSEAEQSARLELERVAHRLAGAAGTFGFAEVSTIALEVEDILVAGRSSPFELMALNGAAGRLERALAAAIAFCGPPSAT